MLLIQDFSADVLELPAALPSHSIVILLTPLPEWNVEEGLSRSGTVLTSLAQPRARTRERMCARVSFSARQTEGEEKR